MIETIAGIFPPALFITLHILEALFPAQRRSFSLKSRLLGFVYFAIAGAVVGNLPRLWADATAGVSLFHLGALHPVAGAAIAYVVMAFVMYWLHRARHVFTPLWRLHQMHHSTERYDVSTAFLFHPLELCYIPIMGTLIGQLLLGISPEAAMLTGMFGFFNAAFQHSNLRTPRWLGYFIARPESHSVHHARDVHAFNYTDLPIIDMVFGTFRNPAVHEETVGFWDGAAKKLPQMLAAMDVTAPELDRESIA